jgi:hypothetical protein
LSKDPTAQQQHCPIGVFVAAIRHGIPERKRSLGEHPPKNSSKAEASYLLNRDPSSLASENSGNNLAKIIRKNQQANAFVINEKWQQQYSKNVAGNPLWQTGSNGILRFKKRIYIPRSNSLQKEILRACYNNPTTGH